MSHTSRRSFLTTAGAMLAVAAAAPLEAIRPPRLEDAPVPAPGHVPASTPANSWITNQPQYQTVSLYQFTPQLFQPLLGTNFQATDQKGRRVTLRLLAVKDLSAQCHGSQTAFALQFRLVAGKALPQGTYQFSTPPLGTFLLFVVPSRPTKNATYTAIINRI